MNNNFRSGCPISSTLDIVGDKWSLLIIRDMLLHHKMTFKNYTSPPPFRAFPLEILELPKCSHHNSERLGYLKSSGFPSWGS